MAYVGCDRGNLSLSWTGKSELHGTIIIHVSTYDKYAKGWNKFFAFEYSFSQRNFTKAFGKLSTNPKIKKYKLYQKLYPS